MTESKGFSTGLIIATQKGASLGRPMLRPFQMPLVCSESRVVSGCGLLLSQLFYGCSQYLGHRHASYFTVTFKPLFVIIRDGNNCLWIPNFPFLYLIHKSYISLECQ